MPECSGFDDDALQNCSFQIVAKSKFHKFRTSSGKTRVAWTVRNRMCTHLVTALVTNILDTFHLIRIITEEEMMMQGAAAQGE